MKTTTLAKRHLQVKVIWKTQSVNTKTTIADKKHVKIKKIKKFDTYSASHRSHLK